MPSIVVLIFGSFYKGSDKKSEFKKEVFLRSYFCLGSTLFFEFEKNLS